MASVPRKAKNPDLKHNGNTGFGFSGMFNPFNAGFGTSSGRIVNNQLLEIIKNLDTFISLNRPLLDFLFLKLPLMEKIIKLAPQEALSKKFTYHSLQYSQEEIDVFEKAWEELNILDKLLDANWKKRLYGGSALIIDLLPQGMENNTAEARNIMNANWAKPLSDKEVTEAAGIDFIAADLWELSMLGTNMESSVNPQTFNLDAADSYFFYYGKKIHRSRLILFKGEPAPSLYAPIYRGWGKSYFEGLLEPLRAYILILTLALELANEKKIDVFGIEGLTSSIAGGQEGNIKAQMNFIQEVKDFTGAITLDKTRHEFTQRQLQIGDLREIADFLTEQLVANTDYPYQRLMGSAPNRPNNLGGNNVDAKNDNYFLRLESIQKENIYYIKAINHYLSLFYFGKPLEDLKITFETLYSLTPEQEEAQKQGIVARLQTLHALKPELVTDELVRQIINEGKLLPMQIDEIFIPENSLNNKQLKKESFLNKFFKK